MARLMTGVGIVSLVLSVSPVTLAGTWNEVGDAPDWPAATSWQSTVGGGPLTAITGATSLALGDLVDANEALRLGLVNQVVAADQLADATCALAERLAQGPTLAHGFAKAAVYKGASLPFASLLDLEARNQQIAGRSHDAREGVRAFIERRKPEFRGR